MGCLKFKRSSPTTRIGYVLLIAAATLAASCNGLAAEPSTSTQLASSDLTQATGVGKRFLRSYKADEKEEEDEEDGQEDESEEEEYSEEREASGWTRRRLMTCFTCPLDDAVYKTTLKSALAGDETMQAKLFDMWVKAPKKERQAEINKIVFSREGVDGNKAFFEAWNKFEGAGRVGHAVRYTGPK
ncbi:hypothetical protein PHYSODRAFT_301303 [Phytophthora sojae]|uniref:RxLR effector protein n=1 Tax=Phytophthora sojae (strain P6497) TaxID=1094619 RepID=G4ZIY4_PHYSP|nr:hypothetical protein PHYSODRAFT_301303 [Phytophthora sojae]EGZ18789.1 hypothetical protein PHYSODRAFT_301303 [Phytophthora sojae]|eukprot:XP_009527847.1 hypothetical protein PHYSODRAFT_301303 [Phytophthora sojae]